MKKIDARKLTPRELEEKRKIVIEMREKGMPHREVAKIVGISEQTTSIYYSRYKKEGNKVFEVKPSGRPKGSNKKLTLQQEKHIIDLLVDKTPKELKFNPNYALESPTILQRLSAWVFAKYLRFTCR